MCKGTIYSNGNILRKRPDSETKRQSGSDAFDANTQFHVHIYNQENNGICDYYDPELEVLLVDYFR